MLPSPSVAEDLAIYRQEFSACLGDHPNIAEILEFIRQSEGKALRPQLLLTFCSLFGCQDEERFKLAVATEYIHNASLIHDDIIDEAESRRNQETLHNKWGVKDAILVGDFLYSRAFELICQTKHKDALGLFANAANRLSISEINQADAYTGKGDNIKHILADENICLTIAKEKTAILFAAVCEAAVMLSAKELQQQGVQQLASHRKAAFNYGINLGLAFQLMDDHLDYSSASNKWGKKRFQDLSEGKVTLPMVYLYEVATNAEKEFILEVLQQSSPDQQGLDEIYSMMQNYEILTKLEDKIDKFATEAVVQLESLATATTSAGYDDLKGLALAASSRNY